MALRHFVDDGGRSWSVWDVYPALLERRLMRAGPPPGLRERRRRLRDASHLSPDMARGWLAFEARDGERRRLTPIPTLFVRWSDAGEDQLCFWCEVAETVMSSPRR